VFDTVKEDLAPSPDALRNSRTMEVTEAAATSSSAPPIPPRKRGPPTVYAGSERDGRDRNRVADSVSEAATISRNIQRRLPGREHSSPQRQTGVRKSLNEAVQIQAISPARDGEVLGIGQVDHRISRTRLVAGRCQERPNNFPSVTQDRLTSFCQVDLFKPRCSRGPFFVV